MFALSEELLRSKLKALESEYVEFDQRLLTMPKRSFTGEDFAPWIGQKFSEIAPLAVEIAKCFESDVRQSWGQPGELADPIKILKAATRLVDLCRHFLKWELEVCSAEPPAKLRAVRDSLRGTTGCIIGDVMRGTDELARAIADVRGGSKDFRVHMFFSSLPPAMRCVAEMEKITNNAGRLSETPSPTNHRSKLASYPPQTALRESANRGHYVWSVA